MRGFYLFFIQVERYFWEGQILINWLIKPLSARWGEDYKRSMGGQEL